MIALVAEGMNGVNAVILERMQSKVALIPELAGHLIAGGGKRMRPMLTLACVLGSILYRIALALALSSNAIGLTASDVNVVTAVLVAVALWVPVRKATFVRRPK